MDIHRVYELLFKPFRVARMRSFRAALHPTESTTILDVGGTASIWDMAGMQAKVTLLNLSVPEGCAGDRYTCVAGSGTALQYPDASFDVAFSNSVIEHLQGNEERRAFARELRRVGRGLWVQTPARSFPFEPHLLAPFIHFLPSHWQRRLVRNFTGWGLLTRPSAERADEVLRGIRLLGFDTMRELFPDCEIRVERFLGLAKSYIAVRQRV